MGSGNAQRLYVAGHDMIGEAFKNLNQEFTRHYLYDGHGSVRAMADISDGTIVGNYDYDSYGNMLKPSDTILPQYRYAGQYYDTNTQMYYNRARYYNPQNGRFNRMDDYAGSPQAPQSLHKYLYAHANPINNIDPTGNFTLTEMVTVAALTGLAMAAITGLTTAVQGGSVSQVIDAQINGFNIGFYSTVAVYTAVWAVSLILVMLFGPGSEETINRGTELYRVVNGAELKIINKSHSFQFPSWGDTPTGEAGKFFWGSFREAVAWQQNLTRFGEKDLTIIKTTIDSTAPVWRFGGIADGIGNSYFVTMEYLTGTIEIVGKNGG